MTAPADAIEVMSTRLFPKNAGAAAYRITGIAARCDWVVLSDPQPPRTALVNRAGTSRPRHIFLSLRNPFEALAYFVDEVLPAIDSPFVLVTGSEDVTIPHQLDLRLRPFNQDEARRIQSLLDDPRLLRWFAENLDDASHPKLSPLPLGMVFPLPSDDCRLSVPTVAPPASRPLRALCAHRVREGPQWDLRRCVTELSRGPFSQWCTVVEDELSEEAFLELVHAHSFVICVSGGGLDPSPKAWQAILHGAIPIVLSTALDGAYRRLPVAFVERWDASALSAERLEAWRRQYSASQDPDNRKSTVELLGIDYWWSVISSSVQHIPDTDAT